MSLFFSRAVTLADVGVEGRGRGRSVGSVPVNSESALRHSAVWACLRLRADLVSTLPLDAYRRVGGPGGMQVQITPTPFLTDPSRYTRGMPEWLYASQIDLDRHGNTMGLISAVSADGKPRFVDLWPAAEVTIRGRGQEITGYRYGGEDFEPSQVWHERQFVVAGIPVGLSPLVYAAWSIGGYLSAQQFALDWFSSGAHPSGVLRHKRSETLPAAVLAAAKERFKVAVQDRDVFVTGSDWEWSPGSQDAAGTGWLQQMQFGAQDVARFFGVPSDLIDASMPGSSVTYANISQRNLQFLIMNLGPALVRREFALSSALAAPRFVKFATDALLRLDPATRVTSLLAQVSGRTLAPSEVRALDNREPFTDDQLAEFDRLFGAPRSAAPAEGVR